MPTTQDDLLSWCTSQQAWLLETIGALVRLESPSDDKAAVDRCGAELAARLAAAGTRVERLPQSGRGDHLRATVGEHGPPVLLLGHFDTVWPIGSIERMPLRSEEHTSELQSQS